MNKFQLFNGSILLGDFDTVPAACAAMGRYFDRAGVVLRVMDAKGKRWCECEVLSINEREIVIKQTMPVA